MRLLEALHGHARARVPYYNDLNMMKNPHVGKYIVAYYGMDNYIHYNLHWADSMKWIKALPADQLSKVQGRNDWERC